MTLEGKDLAVHIAQAALDKQAEEVTVLDVRGISGITDFFVLCTAGSSRQIDAVHHHVYKVVKEAGATVMNAEGISAPAETGREAMRWVLLDCGDVVVHIMDERTREFYRLERLWGDAPRIPVEDASLPARRDPNPS